MGVIVGNSGEKKMLRNIIAYRLKKVKNIPTELNTPHKSLE